MTYSVTDGNGCTGTASIDVQVDDCAGIKENELSFVSIYPNPFTSSISIDNKDGIIRSLKLIDLNGRVLSEMNQVNSGMVRMGQLEGISSGTYLLILSGENSSKAYKVIK